MQPLQQLLYFSKTLHRAIVPLFCLTLILGSSLIGATETPRQSPIDVVSLPYSDGRARITVEWGSQGETLDRSPREIIDQYNRLKAWLQSPEVLDQINVEQERLASIESQMGKQQAREVRKRHEATPQRVLLQRLETNVVRDVPLATWQMGIPFDLRATLTIAFFDAADLTQVRWAVAQRERNPTAVIMAVGWDSLADLEATMRQHPSLKAMIIPDVPEGRSHAEALADYDVKHLPALVTFPDAHHARIHEGIQF